MPPIPQALFLDRDGTLIEWVDYLHEPSKVVLCDRVAEALKTAKAAGCLLFLHTNQSGVGRGYFGMDAVEAVNARMYKLMGVSEDFFDGVCIATELPGGVGQTRYRKPSPLYEQECIATFGLDPTRCYLLGDSVSDLDTARHASIEGVWIKSERPAEQIGDEVPRFGSVAEFVARHFPRGT